MVTGTLDGSCAESRRAAKRAAASHLPENVLPLAKRWLFYASLFSVIGAPRWLARGRREKTGTAGEFIE
jgi:hypothetical protein